MANIIAVFPGLRLDLQITLAACKAGEIGTLDLGWTDDDAAILPPIYKLRSMMGQRRAMKCSAGHV